MADILKTIWISVITNGALLALFVYVFKQLFENSLKRRTELSLRELELANRKNYYQFSKLYDEQASVIKDVYTDLAYMFGQVKDLVYSYSRIESEPQIYKQYLPTYGSEDIWCEYKKKFLEERKNDTKAEVLYKFVKESSDRFKIKKIYFQKTIVDEIEKLYHLITFIAFQYKNISYRASDDLKAPLAKEVYDVWTTAVAIVYKLFPVLEELFRNHLGIDKEETKGE